MKNVLISLFITNISLSEVSTCLCAQILQRLSEIHCSNPVRLKLFNFNRIVFMLLTMMLLNLSVIYPDYLLLLPYALTLQCIVPNFLLFSFFSECLNLWPQIS